MRAGNYRISRALARIPDGGRLSRHGRLDTSR